MAERAWLPLAGRGHNLGERGVGLGAGIAGRTGGREIAVTSLAL